MTEDSKKTEKKKSTAKRAKTGGGAWWKSSSLLDTQPVTEPASSPAPQSAEASITPPAKKEELDAQTKTTAVLPQTADNFDSAPPMDDTAAGEAAPKKPRRRPSSRKKKAEKAPEVPAIDTIETAEPSDQKMNLEPVEQIESPADAAQSPTKRSRGGRRKSRRGKKNKSIAVDQMDVSLEEDGSVQVDSSAQQNSDGNFLKEMIAGERRDAGWLDDDRDEESWREDASDFRDEGQTCILPDDEPEETKKRVSKLLINAEEPEECRLAILENGKLESIHVSTVTKAQIKNNIYKARIVAIEANLQAAFVDYGLEKNGFLPFSEIHPEYYKENLSDSVRKLVENHHWKKLSISDVLEKGQEVLVQVVKEEVGKKGANMTTYLSLPGRSVVLMPGSDSSGISRKIVGEERRSHLRTAMNALDIPEGIGWIVRTASNDMTRAGLARDVAYLLRLWEEIKKKGQEMDGVGQLYEDHQSVLRFLREHFDPSIEEILVDNQEAYEQVQEFVALLPDNQQHVKVRLHKGSRPIFNQFSIEDQIESIYQPKVNLPSGGSIVIDPTEALVAIDVNSGSTGRGQNFEETIFQANMEAAAELARQLRLRDLGGLIVIDFIDMRNKKHIRDVETQVKNAMKRDKAKVDISRISKFGLMQISRQKLGAPIESGNYHVCPHCKGRGLVRSVETLALFYLRRIQTGASRKNVVRVECRFPLDVASYLLNAKRKEVLDMESKYNTEIAIIAEPAMKPADNDIVFHKLEKETSGKKTDLRSSGI